MMSEEERKILHKDSAKFTYDADPYPELSEQEWVLVQRAEQSIARWGTDFPFGELLDYARHHHFPQGIIDILEDYHHKKVAWLCLQGPEVAIHGFVEAIRARGGGEPVLPVVQRARGPGDPTIPARGERDDQVGTASFGSPRPLA
jgi:hypothetical protein